MALAVCVAAPPAEPGGVDDEAVCDGGTAERCSSADAPCVGNVAKNRKQQNVTQRFMRTRFPIETWNQAAHLGKLIKLKKCGENSTLDVFRGPEIQSEARQTVPRSLRQD